MVDIKKVALKADVSIATVSRVINNSGLVSEKTKQKVLSTIEDMDYKPNIMARNFRMNKTNTILTVLNDIRNPVFSEIIKGLEDVAYKNDYSMLIGNSGNSIEREKNYLECIRAKRVDGAILITPRVEHSVIKELASHVPVILINDIIGESSIPSVGIDDFNASYDITDYLIKLGHVKIGCIAGNTKVSIARERLGGFKKALEDSKLPVEEEWIIMAGNAFEDGYKAMNELITAGNLPTALVSYNDEVAIGAIHCAGDNGINLPGELSIVGFDNISTATIIKPKLTTVNQPKYDMGACAMNMLIDMMNGNKPEKLNTKLKHSIVVRESAFPAV